MDVTISNLLAAFDDVEPATIALEAQAQALPGDEASLLSYIERLRSFSERAHSVAHRAAQVSQYVEARLTQVRDAKRAA